MVRRIRQRGHVIRFHEVPPGTSGSKAQSCPTCKDVYDNGVYRKCYYLCCEFEECFHCVLNNKSRCPIIKTRFLQERVLAVNLNDELDSDINIKSGPNCETVKFPAPFGKRQKVVVVSERQLQTEVNLTPYKEAIKLPQFLDEHVVKIELDSDMEIQSESSVETANLIDVSSRIQNEALEDYWFDNSINNGERNAEIESDERDLKLAIAQLGLAEYNWLPVILLDNELFPASNLQDAIAKNRDEEHGISKFKNEKIFTTNE